MQPKLTRREKEIFNLLLDGLVPKEIIGKLNINYNTVIFHQRNIYRKLYVHSIDELFEKYRNKKPVVYLEDGTYFTGRTFNEVVLYANKWLHNENWYGENYFSGNRIRFNDIYNGNIHNLVPNPRINNVFRFKLTGTIDKECKNLKIELFYITNYGDWIYLFGTPNDNFVSIGPGDFSKIVLIQHGGIDINTLPKDGVYYFCLLNVLYDVSENPFDSGDRIPCDMPNHKIWATINDLRIEPVL